MTLTSDLVCRTSIKSGAYLLYSLKQEFQIFGSVGRVFDWGSKVASLRLTADGVTVVLMHLWMGECHVQIWRVEGSWDDRVLYHP